MPVQRNGRVGFERKFYSVPYVHIGCAVGLRLTETMLEVFAGAAQSYQSSARARRAVNEYRTHDSDLTADRNHVQPASAVSGSQTCRVIPWSGSAERSPNSIVMS